MIIDWKNIGYDLKKFDCIYIQKTFIHIFHDKKHTIMWQKMIYEEFNVKCCTTKFCKIDISIIWLDFTIKPHIVTTFVHLSMMVQLLCQNLVKF